MTRSDVMKIFPNATEEQIQNLLNSHHNELSAEKEKNKNLSNSTNEELAKAQAELETLRKQAEENNANDLQTQIDKLNKANEEAQRTIKNMELKASLLSQGFGADDVDLYIKTVNEGGDIASVLGQMKQNVISAYDKARMDATPSPRGSGNTPPTTEDSASKLAKKVMSESVGNKDTKSILENYKSK